MEFNTFCQSCGMPLPTEDLKGTEENGMKNNDYCMHCYENSQFRNPEINLDEMKMKVTTKMETMNRPNYLIQKAVRILPALKRWNKKNQENEIVL